MEWLIIVGIAVVATFLYEAFEARSRAKAPPPPARKRSRSRSRSSHTPKRPTGARASKTTAKPRPSKPDPVLWEGQAPAYAQARLKRDRVVYGGSVSNRDDKNEPGRVYLVRRDDVYKVGITSGVATTDRVNEHQSYGWELRGVWDLPTLLDARAVEKSVLAFWRTTLEIKHADVFMPQSGITETAVLVAEHAEATIKLIERETAVIEADSWPSERVADAMPGRRVHVGGRIVGKGQQSVGSTWWKVEIDDGSGRRLTIEFSAGVAAAVDESPIGSELEVRGVILSGGSHLVMTNPQFRLPSSGPESGWQLPEVTDSWRNAREVRGWYVRTLYERATRLAGWVIEAEGREITLFSDKPPRLVGPGVTLHAVGRFRDRTTFDATTISVP